MRRTFLIWAALAAASPAWASSGAQLQLYPAAKVAMPELGVPVGVRAVGMGQAYTAVGRDVTMLRWNPAGLARIAGYQLALMDNEWSSALGLRQDFLAYGMGVGEAAGLGVSVDYFSLGSLSQRDVSGALVGQDSTAYSLAADLGYGQSFLAGDALKLGVVGEFGQESLYSQGNSAFAASLGLLYDLDRSVALGLSVLHAGAAGGGFSPPTQVNGGLAVNFNNQAVILALDGNYPLNGTPGMNAGAEVNFSGLSLRGGWRQAFGAPEGDVSSGFTMGAGFKAGVFSLDYAFVPYGDLSTAHRVAATIDLPADFFKPKVIGAESSTFTARTYYDKGREEQKNASLLQALVQFQRAKDAYPDALVRSGKAQEFYRDSLRRIESIQKQMASSGNNESLRAAVTKRVNAGQEALQAHRYMDAIQAARDALGLDSTDARAQSLLKQAQSAFVARKKDLLAQGDDAYSSGQLATAIQKYREALQLDPRDEEAQAFFNNHRAEVRDKLTQIHRKGIDLYLAGHIREAVAIWKDGKKLDPSDPLNFQRDIDKAEKVLEVRGGK